MSDVDRLVEAVANELRRLEQQHRDFDQRFNWESWARSVLSAVFVAQVGCEQCGGTGRQVQVLTRPLEDVPIAMPTAIEGPCPAVHVEIDNPYGGTVWADPNKVEWREEVNTIQAVAGAVALVWSEQRDPRFGRWVPRPLEVPE